MRVRLKVCCIGSTAEAKQAIALGADALGLVSAMPSGPGVITEEQIRAIAATIPPPVTPFLLTSAREPDALIAQQRRCGVHTLQLVDRLDLAAYPVLRAALPDVKLVQVVHVTGPDAVGEAEAAAPHVDALLLDSGNPTTAVKELGGTGRTHDWAHSRRIVEAVSVPVFLAGGLHAGNAAEAVARVRPFGLDVCSGVRTDGRLDVARLRAFAEALYTDA